MPFFPVTHKSELPHSQHSTLLDRMIRINPCHGYIGGNCATIQCSQDPGKNSRFSQFLGNTCVPYGRMAKYSPPVRQKKNPAVVTARTVFSLPDCAWCIRRTEQRFKEQFFHLDQIFFKTRAFSGGFNVIC